MKIGVPKEIKPQENRIGLTPDSVKTLWPFEVKILTLSGVKPILFSCGLISFGTPISIIIFSYNLIYRFLIFQLFHQYVFFHI